jgi:Flp pilus assembly protein protease CpaA
MIELVLVGVVLGAAAYNDIRTTEVPDWLSYSGIAIGIALHAFQSIMAWSWAPLVESAVGFGLFICIGCALYYGGQWGGGDSKILMAIGAILGLPFTTIPTILNAPLIGFFLNLLWVGALYGIVWVIYLAIRHKKQFVPAYRSFARQPLMKTLRVISLVAGIGIAVVGFSIADPIPRFLLLVLALLLPCLFHILLVTKAVEQGCMLRWRTPDKLLEGDWIVNDVIVKGHRITGPADLGIPQSKINLLKRLAKRHTIRVLVKDGIPFVPSFFIAFIITLIIGNPLVWL